MTDEALPGRCACGAVRYRMTSRPLIVHCCHCRECQRQTGTAFALNALIETNRVVLESGATETTPVPTLSGRGQKIVRCQECRVAVWSHYAGMGDGVSFVRVGTLEDPDALPPGIHIFTESKQPWIALPDGVPAVPKYYKHDAWWPEESLARWRVLRG
jgi:hypothetical protein